MGLVAGCFGLEAGADRESQRLLGSLGGSANSREGGDVCEILEALDCVKTAHWVFLVVFLEVTYLGAYLRPKSASRAGRS